MPSDVYSAVVTNKSDSDGTARTCSSASLGIATATSCLACATHRRVGLSNSVMSLWWRRRAAGSAPGRRRQHT